MKTIRFAVGALVLTLSCGDITLALTLNRHAADYRSHSSVEALSADPFVFQDPQVPLTNDDVVKMFGAGLTESPIVHSSRRVPKGPGSCNETREREGSPSRSPLVPSILR